MLGPVGYLCTSAPTIKVAQVRARLVKVMPSVMTDPRGVRGPRCLSEGHRSKTAKAGHHAPLNLNLFSFGKR